MAFSEYERLDVEKAFALFRKRRGPSPDIRAKLDWGCKIEGQSIELYEIRPRWNDPTQITHSPFAKATFVRSTQEWRIYWRRASGKWNGYPPYPSARSLEEFFSVVGEDAEACFFG